MSLQSTDSNLKHRVDKWCLGQAEHLEILLLEKFYQVCPSFLIKIVLVSWQVFNMLVANKTAHCFLDLFKVFSSEVFGEAFNVQQCVSRLSLPDQVNKLLNQKLKF